jgi:hypothetical protein
MNDFVIAELELEEEAKEVDKKKKNRKDDKLETSKRIAGQLNPNSTEEGEDAEDADDDEYIGESEG